MATPLQTQGGELDEIARSQAAIPMDDPPAEVGGTSCRRRRIRAWPASRGQAQRHGRPLLNNDAREGVTKGVTNSPHRRAPACIPAHKTKQTPDGQAPERIGRTPSHSGGFEV